MNFAFYKQPDQKDCGTTCLHAVAKRYGSNFKAQALWRLCEINGVGLFLMSISDTSKKIGFRFRGVKNKVLICFILLCFCFSCKKRTLSTSISISRPLKQNDSIVLFNKINDNAKIGLYNISMYETDIFPIVFEGGKKTEHTISAAESVFFLSNNLNTVFMINPGEHVDIRSSPSGKAMMSIKNNAQRTNELAFFYDLNNKYPETAFKLAKINSLKDFRYADSISNLWYQNASDFLNTYGKTHKVSIRFTQITSKYLYYERLSRLLELSFNAPNAAEFIRGTRYEKFPVCDSCLAMPHYRFALFYTNKILSRDNTSAPFVTEFNIAKKTLTGNTKKWMLYSILNSYMNNNIRKPEFDERLYSFFDTYPKDTLTKILKLNYSNKSAALNSHSVFDDRLSAVDDKFIKWGDVLSKNRGKVILIDFWARYCGPCVHEIPFSQNLETELSDKNVVFIYVSFDVSKTTWVDGMNELNFKKNRQNSYLLPIPSRSYLNSYYNLRTIPKYIIYDKKGNLVTKDGPRPSDPALKNLLNKLTAE